MSILLYEKYLVLSNKQNQILPATLAKFFYFQRKQSIILLDKELQCKTKVIQTDVGIFRHHQVYPGIIQVYPGIFK